MTTIILEMAKLFKKIFATSIGGPLSLGSSGLPIVPCAIVCLLVFSTARAVVPPPDGCYPNYTTAEGCNALKNLGTGAGNTGLGWYSLFSDSTGNFNTGVGAGTLALNNGDSNTAVGTAALLFNTTGNFNTANGVGALQNNTIAAANTATGVYALLNNTTGNTNTATGFQALRDNTTGSNNTAVGAGTLLLNTADGNTAMGFEALLNNITGDRNTAIGESALFNNTQGNSNTAIGRQALFSNTTGGANVASGPNALFNNTSGNFNIAIGENTLVSNSTGNNNTAVGSGAFTSSTGSGNIALGVVAGSSVSTANNVICIGAAGANVNNSCYIGQIYSTIQPIVGTDPDSVTVASNGRLGRGNVSSRRYKHDIKPLDKSSERLHALKPVSFRYNEEYDPTQTLAFGLIAEEVAEVYPDLVGRNSAGQPESVRYEQINALLLNEFLKEHHQVQELKAIVAKQQKQIKALTAGLQKVSARVEYSKPARQVVTVP